MKAQRNSRSFSLLPVTLIVAIVFITCKLGQQQAVGNFVQLPKATPVMNKYPIHYKTVKIDRLNIFYREAGPAEAPVVLLMHGFPSSSFMFRNLIVSLKKKYHVIAPDYPGFGFSSFPATDSFNYTFENLSVVMEKFVDKLKIKKFSIYIQDYGSPVGMRLIQRRPELLESLIVQNGNMYEQGLGEPWKPIKEFWKDPHNKTKRQSILDFFTLSVTKFQYEAGMLDTSLLSPESYHFDQQFLDRPGSKDMQLQLMYDYRNNVLQYPNWQKTLRSIQPPTLVVWGENDPFFTKEGALLYGKDITNTEFHFYPTGHFALEDYNTEIAGAIDAFLQRLPAVSRANDETPLGQHLYAPK